MKIHEYQAKQLMAARGIPVPQGVVATTVDQAVAAVRPLIEETGNKVVVVKSQIHAGGRGKGRFLEHPDIVGISFVGSSPVAQHVYRTAAEHGKRVQALGGAKNFIVVMPDADMDRTLDAITESAYGCAGERCLAGAVVLAVGDEAHDRVRQGLLERARSLQQTREKPVQAHILLIGRGGPERQQGRRRKQKNCDRCDWQSLHSVDYDVNIASAKAPLFRLAFTMI